MHDGRSGSCPDDESERRAKVLTSSSDIGYPETDYLRGGFRLQFVGEFSESIFQAASRPQRIRRRVMTQLSRRYMMIFL